MFAEQGDNRSRIKSICIYSVLTVCCIVFGYIETLIPTALIAPGIKLGLANSVALMLIIFGDIKGAVLVNTARILLSAVLFGSLFSLLFSLCAGTASVAVCILVAKSKSVSAVGISIAGAVTHNTVQTAIAFFVLNKGVLFYLPILIISAIISGFVIAVISILVSKKLKSILSF
ncbi:MAG: Gx transporter family protein [Clostridia bacterium]|nr:Gx transporter family protein [Clostridia bacterium]